MPRGDGTWILGAPYQALKPGPCKQFFPNYDCEMYEWLCGPHRMVVEGVFDPHGAETARIADHFENVTFLDNLYVNYNLVRSTPEQMKTDWFNRGGVPPGQPLFANYLELYALRDDVKPFIRTYFNMLAEMFNREDLTIYENSYPSVWNKTAETGRYLQLTRLIFVQERDGELWLAPFVSQHWMKDGLSVKIGQAPTFFGPVGYEITSHAAQGYIEAKIQPSARKAPKAIVLRVRHPEGKPMKRVTVNGAEWKEFDAAKEIVRLKPAKGLITVRAEY